MVSQGLERIQKWFLEITKPARSSQVIETISDLNRYNRS